MRVPWQASAAGQAVDGGDLLEPFRLQASRCDPRRRGAQHAGAVQRERLMCHAQGGGLAGAGLAAYPPPSGDRVTPRSITGLVLSDRGMLRPGPRAPSRAHTPRPVRHAAGPHCDQALLDSSNSGVDQRRSSSVQSATTLTARCSRNRSASPSSSARPAPTSCSPSAAITSGRANVDARAVSPCAPASRSNTPATTATFVVVWVVIMAA
jgi:hypothetical protein